MNHPVQNIKDMSELQALVSGGYISARKHPTRDLTIYNYTQKAAHDVNIILAISPIILPTSRGLAWAQAHV